MSHPGITYRYSSCFTPKTIKDTDNLLQSWVFEWKSHLLTLIYTHINTKITTMSQCLARAFLFGSLYFRAQMGSSLCIEPVLSNSVYFVSSPGFHSRCSSNDGSFQFLHHAECATQYKGPDNCNLWSVIIGHYTVHPPTLKFIDPLAVLQNYCTYMKYRTHIFLNLGMKFNIMEWNIMYKIWNSWFFWCSCNYSYKMGGIWENIPTWAHVYHDGLNEDSSAQLQSKYVHTLHNYFAIFFLSSWFHAS